MKIVNIVKTQESKTEAQQGIKGWKQDIIRNAKVLVIGAGALGNETLKNLSLIGVGYALVCDMDYVDTSNLSRTVLFSEKDLGQMKAPAAARRFTEMNVEETGRADSFIGNVVSELGMGVFRHVDLVIGCLDNAQARFETNRRCALLGKTFIDAGIANLLANVTVVHSTETEPCWACKQTRKAREEAIMQNRHSCYDTMRKARSTGHVPTTQVTSALAAALQCQEIVKCLHDGKSEEMQASYGRAYGFNGWYNNFVATQITRKEDCPFHTAYKQVEETEMSYQWTLEQVLNYVEEKYGPGWVMSIEADSSFQPAEFVTTGQCLYCGKELTFNRSCKQIEMEDLFCDECPHEARDRYQLQKMVCFSKDEACRPYMQFTLEQLGIPVFHILDFFNKEDPEKTMALELTADMKRVMPSL